MTRYAVATVGEIPPGSRKIVQIAERSIGVFNIHGAFYAIRNRCPHQGGPLCEGNLIGLVLSTRPAEYSYVRDGEIVRCPWHGWEFDVKTGQSWFDPAHVRVKQYRVFVEARCQDAAPEMPGMLKGPYVAETYPVSVDRDLVVVDIPS